MSMEGALLGMGNPLLDISQEISETTLLDKYELKMGDAILAEPKHLPLYEEMVAGKVDYIGGGATQNSIRVAQWMLQAKGATSYIGSVGKDKFGEQLKNCVEGDGVAVYYHEDEKVATGTCACLIKDKERSMVANLSAANEYKQEHLVSDKIKPVWEKAKVVYIAGFFLTVSPESIATVGEHCCAENKYFAMNLSAPFIMQFFGDKLAAALVYTDIVFGNESEAATYAEVHKLEDKSPKAVALHIAAAEKKNSKRSRMAIITQGSESTIVAQDGKVTEYAVDKIPADKIVDVNGAGDAFVGGFLAALLHGKSTEECVKTGHYSASVILGTSGTALPSSKPTVSF